MNLAARRGLLRDGPPIVQCRRLVRCLDERTRARGRARRGRRRQIVLFRTGRLGLTGGIGQRRGDGRQRVTCVSKRLFRLRAGGRQPGALLACGLPIRDRFAPQPIGVLTGRGQHACGLLGRLAADLCAGGERLFQDGQIAGML